MPEHTQSPANPTSADSAAVLHVAAPHECRSRAAEQLPDEVDLTLFVACYNEETGIVETLDTIAASLGTVGLSYEVLVIDDCSTDRSVELVRDYCERHPDIPVTCLVNETNRGLAYNYIDGAFLGRGRYYRLVCGDNVESRDILEAIFARVGEADMVIPYHPEVVGKAKWRIALSRTYTTIVNFVSGHSIRYYNGAAVHTRHNVMRWHSRSRGFGFQADLISRLLDERCSYVEVPVFPHEREGGQSQAVTIKNVLSIGHMLAEMVIRRVSRLVYGPSRGTNVGTSHGLARDRASDAKAA